MVAFLNLLCHQMIAYSRGESMYFRRIEDMHIDHDLTQQNVADFLECNREVYRRYEKGTREIPVWALIRLAEYYDCSIDYLLGVTDSKRRFGK